MLKIETSERKTDVTINGNIAMICTDCITGIHAVYNMIKDDNAFLAKEFKSIIMDNLYLAFVDDDELKSELEKAEKKSNPREILAEVLNMIDDGKPLSDVISFLESKKGEKR